MKKLLLLPLIFMSLFAGAQTEKGTLMVGAGILGANGYSQNGNKYYNINLNPRAGVFVTNKLAVGTTVILGLSGANGYNAFNYGLLPFSRYYFTKKQTSLFVEADLGLQGYHLFGKNNGQHDGSEFSFGAGPGVSHFITPNVGIEALLKVRRYSGVNGGESSVRPALNIGFQIYLNTHNKQKASPAK